MAAHVGTIQAVNAFIARVFQQPKGDFADRLNARVTVVILAISSALLLSSHFFGDPITCWTPAQFTGEWIKFVNKYCFVHGTYFVPMNQQLSALEEERQHNSIQYYQWVPYVLAVQALFFYLPRFTWKALIAHSGYDLAGAVKYVASFWEIVKTDNVNFKSRISAFEGRPSEYIWDGLRLARKKKRSRDMGLYYTLATLLQTINAWIQFYLLNAMLDSPLYAFYSRGPSILIDLISGEDWQTTGHFPRIVHCDFNMRRPAGTQLDTVLCVLTLNIYYEKLFVFLWFWLFFVALVSTFNCMKWTYALCSSTKAQKRMEGFLETSPVSGDRQTAQTAHVNDERFFRILGPDGLFVLEQMALNLGDIPASYLTISMRNICRRWEEDSYDDEYRGSERVPLAVRSEKVT